MKKLLIVVPTKNRAGMVNDVLEYELPYYSKKQLDICYFDSGDDETENIIHEANVKFGTEIQYQKSPSDFCLDYKLVSILKTIKNWDYDYYWLINDSISISEEMLDYVIELLDRNYSLIRLPLSGAGPKEDYETTNVNEWFFNCSSGMAHMASTIMHKSLLEVEKDFDGLCSKYVFNNELNDKHGFFFMVGFYLEEILKLDEFKGCFIGNRYKWRHDSTLKRDNIYWKEFVFETWAKSYVETILKLPGLYVNKEEVIKKSDNIGPGRFSKYNLIHYRLSGLYDIRKYLKYRKYFKYVSAEKELTCLLVSLQSKKYLLKKYSSLSALEASWESKLDSIEESIQSQSLVIYGAGLYGEKVLKKLVEDGFANQIKGVAVTDIGNNVDKLCGYEVRQIDFYIADENNRIIICALPGTAVEMKKELDKFKCTNYTSLFGI